MTDASTYWTLMKLDFSSDRGVRPNPIPEAKTFFHEHFPDVNLLALDNRSIQVQLFLFLKSPQQNRRDPTATSYLCLRCHTSHLIRYACYRIERDWTKHGIQAQELLPLVLDDDGRLHGTYIPFSFRLLDSFDPLRGSSLTTWVETRIKQHPEVRRLLLDRGIVPMSNWSLLNRIKPSSISQIRDRVVIEVFHRVYRRDRQTRYAEKGYHRCEKPSPAQLAEMRHYLNHQGIEMSEQTLIQTLNRLAKELRERYLWAQRKTPDAASLDVSDPETNEPVVIEKYLSPVVYEEQGEEAYRSELRSFCIEHTTQLLEAAMREKLHQFITSLAKKKKHAQRLTLIKLALKQFYQYGVSLSELAPLLGLTEQYQVSRLLKIRELVRDIRARTRDLFLDHLLKKAKEESWINTDPSKPDYPTYLDNLIQAIESYLDQEIFQDAFAEIMNGRGRKMDSFYAQKFRQILAE